MYIKYFIWKKTEKKHLKKNTQKFKKVTKAFSILFQVIRCCFYSQGPKNRSNNFKERLKNASET